MSRSWKNVGGVKAITNDDIVDELKIMKETQSDILERLNEPIDTQLTGSNVEEITVLDAMAKTDTVTTNLFDSYGYNVNVAKYRNIDFLITNSHDQPVRIFFRPYAGYTSVMLEDGTVGRYSVYTDDVFHLVPPGVVDLPLSVISARVNGTGKKALQLSPFKKYLIEDFRASFRFQTAPTEGALTVKLLGVPL